MKFEFAFLYLSLFNPHLAFLVIYFKLEMSKELEFPPREDLLVPPDEVTFYDGSSKKSENFCYGQIDVNLFLRLVYFHFLFYFE